MNSREHKGAKTKLRVSLPSFAMIGLLLLSAALVWHDLGAREVLGRDENATITKLDQPSLKAVFDVTLVNITGQPGNMQPVYFLMEHLFWPAIERSTFMLRFLPSAFGLLAVLLTYKLGEALFGSQTGLIGALLTALLPLHVRYAQIARPYTLLAVFSLASACLFVRAVRTDRPLHWAGFVLTATLGFYTHYNTLFALTAEGLFASILWLTMLVAVLKHEQAHGRLVRPALSFVAVGLLCLPGLIRLSRLPFLGLEGELGAESTEIVTLTVPFFRHFLHESGLVARWQQNLLAVLMILGLAAALFRHRRQAALLAILWLAIPFVTLSVINSPRPFEERYVIFVTPVALLLAGQGVVAGGEWLAILGRQWNERAARWAITLVFTIGLAGILAAQVQAYFAINREADRLDQTLVVVEHNVQPGDIVVVSPRFFVRSLAVQHVEVLYLTRHPSFDELDVLASEEGRMWILCTSYPSSAARLQEPLDQWLQARPDGFVVIPIKAVNALAFETTPSADLESGLEESIHVLEELAENSAGRGEAWLRHGVLADVLMDLCDLYDSSGEALLATGCRERVEEIQAAAPPPW